MIYVMLALWVFSITFCKVEVDRKRYGSAVAHALNTIAAIALVCIEVAK